MSGRSGSAGGTLWRRVGTGANLVLFLLALVTIAVVVNYFAQRAQTRLTFDATKTRAYSLSPQTRQLLAGLQGEWTIALIMIEDGSDEAVNRQVEQVLARYREASSAISIRRVDPSDPRTFGEYEALLAELRALDADRIAAYEKALDDGTAGFETLRLFAQQQAGRLEQAIAGLPAEDPRRRALESPLALLGLLAQDGDKVLDMVRQARAVRETQPIPDYETARSILARALSQWADELYAMAGLLRGWRDQDDLDPALVRFSSVSEPEYRTIAQELAVVADPLERLPPLEIAAIGHQLEQGEAAIVIGPDRSAVIPSAQLFPKLNVRAVGDGAVAFDRRFRGEQVISAAIRSLLVPRMPMVVFVHGEASTLLRSRNQSADLVGVATLLDGSRFEVQEWRPGSTERPVPDEGQPAVWVVLPPQRRQSLEPDRTELAVLRTAETLIAEGEPVLINVHPSLLPRYEQPDPWQRLGAPFGLRADTANAVFEETQAADGRGVYQLRQQVQSFAGDHPIANAAHGQMTEFPLAVPLEPLEAAVPEAVHHVLVTVEPDARRWLESDWATKMRPSEEAVVRGEPFAAPVPIFVAARRRHPMQPGEQRFILAGSGGWMLSNVADRAQSVGGDRVVLLNPGNQELLLASVAWLAGLDDLIAPSPVSRQTARLEGVGRAETITWALVTILGVPFVCLACGGLVWLRRR